MNDNPLTPQPRITLIAISMVWIAPLCIMIFLVAACNKISDQVFDQRVNEGIIEYHITFPEVGEESITASLLPDRMTYSFKENAFASHFETAGGMFKNNIIANLETRSLEHQLKVFRKKIKVAMSDADILKMLSQYPKMTVIKTNDTDTIAGYLCKKALIVFEEIEKKEIEVYYTNEIRMQNPNWCTQYHEIDGVLMAYEIEEFGIRMRLEAKSVTPARHEDSFLTDNDGYEVITREMMDIELAQLVETFEL